MGETIVPARERGAFRQRLLAHFDAHARDLPWREDPDPYGVLVSEFMLQQTRVETVVPFYRAWMHQFPDLERLAAADEASVLLQWKGLGYYRRARNLHALARTLQASGGEVPRDPAALRRLPGVGPYTAGAVASIAFQVVTPAVDGNVRRVLARLLDDPRPGAARLEREAGVLVDPDRPGDFNQAMMELGATVCTPRAPRCSACPVVSWCRANRAGTAEERPAPPPRRRLPRLEEVVAVVEDRTSEGGPRILLEPRPVDGLLGGMWQCPSMSHEKEGERLAGLERLLADLALDPPPVVRSPPTPLPPVPHLFTHRHVTYHPFVVRLDGPSVPRPGTAPGGARRWVAADETEGLPLSRAQERIVASWVRTLSRP